MSGDAISAIFARYGYSPNFTTENYLGSVERNIDFSISYNQEQTTNTLEQIRTTRDLLDTPIFDAKPKYC